MIGFLRKWLNALRGQRCGATRPAVALLLILALLLPPLGDPAFAENEKRGPMEEPCPPENLPPVQVRDRNIPKVSQRPPKLGQHVKIKRIGCLRSFRYRGKVYPVDSYHKQDGENIRPIIESVPPAVSELNDYQQNIRSAQVAAYSSTIGLASALIGFWFRRLYGTQTKLVERVDENGYKVLNDKGEIIKDSVSTDLANASRTIGGGMMIGGLTLSVASFLYSVGILRTNETNLRRAAHKYSEARPEDPLELLFDTGNPVRLPRPAVAVFVGGNYSQLHFQLPGGWTGRRTLREDGSRVFSLGFGAMVDIPITHRWSVEPGFVYFGRSFSGHGEKHDQIVSSRWLGVFPMVRYHLVRHSALGVSLGLGPYAARIIGVAKTEDVNIEKDLDLKDVGVLSLYDYGVSAAAAMDFEISHKMLFLLELRGSLGLGHAVELPKGPDGSHYSDIHALAGLRFIL